MLEADGEARMPLVTDGARRTLAAVLSSALSRVVRHVNADADSVLR